MFKSLRFISISHKTASVSNRQQYYISGNEKDTLIDHFTDTFPDISGLLILATCNRTEVYFESEKTTAALLRDELISYTLQETIPKTTHLFSICDITENSVKHLLKVSSGLDSKVLGDAEIICQIKKAYQTSIGKNLQGSLLERAMQSVFQCHKRISNDTHFRDGTTSVAYKALRIIGDTFGREAAKEKKILFIGAGDIVKQLFKYNSKFGYDRICISNRTKANTTTFIRRYDCTWYDWKEVLANEFKDFDVIISAVGNCHRIISFANERSDNRLFLDLALPGNIDPAIKNITNTVFYDLDSISQDFEETKEKRLKAVQHVNLVNEEVLQGYMKWFQEAPLRATLANLKIELHHKIAGCLRSQSEIKDQEKIKLVTDRVIRSVLKEPNPLLCLEKIDDFISEHTEIFKVDHTLNPKDNMP